MESSVRRGNSMDTAFLLADFQVLILWDVAVVVDFGVTDLFQSLLYCLLRLFGAARAFRPSLAKGSGAEPQCSDL